MKIGVVSDSHQNLANLKKAGDFLSKEGIEILVHLGDDFDDMAIFKDINLEKIIIPGVYTLKYYHSPDIPNRLIKKWEGWKVLLTHSPKSHENDLPTDLKPEEITGKSEVDIVIYGHTHIPRVEKEKGIIWINPGHLKDEDKKGYPPTMAILYFTPGNLKVKIIELGTKKEFISENFSQKN
jgi:putative phosphoesterase